MQSSVPIVGIAGVVIDDGGRDDGERGPPRGVHLARPRRRPEARGERLQDAVAHEVEVLRHDAEAEVRVAELREHGHDGLQVAHAGHQLAHSSDDVHRVGLEPARRPVVRLIAKQKELEQVGPAVEQAVEELRDGEGRAGGRKEGEGK